MSNIPKLRFPEFTDAWEKCKLGDVIIDEIKGKAKADMLGEQSLYLDANYLNGGNELYVNSPTDVDKNDVIILWDGSQAGTVYHGFSGALGSTFKAFRPKQSGAFLYQQLKRYQDTIYNSYRTPNIPHVIKSFTKEFNISIPNYEEQQKIGNLFKQLDRLITLHKRKWDDVILLKKALLQKMFPKNGSDFPEIRFPEFTDAWEKCKLGKSFKIKRGLTYKPENIVTNGGIRVLRSSNIDEDTFQLKDDDVFVSRESINIDFVENLDILITSANGSSRLVGKHAIIQHIDNEMVHGGFMLLGKSKEPFFINALLSAPWYEKFINKNVSGGNGAIGNLKAKDLENAVISLPTLPEQQKIGNLFKQLDRLITLHKRQHEHYQLLKKALLQQMFV
ncbi:restriction endonuclease subunit S [Avibacterium avium]|uniref:restriction endonuclease subunit S n=2 Tax=Avibacterium TaxID=292486 RepID=UPI003BF8FA12